MAYLGNSPARIVVDGVTLNATNDGCDWAFDDIDGWHDGPGIEVPQEQRVVSHGQFAQAGRRTGRTITVDGWVAADTRAPVAAAVKSLSSILADGGFGQFALTDDDDGTLTATVQLLERPEIDWTSGTFARFQLQFLAPSAYRFGETSSASTGFAIAPPGSGLVFPLFPDGVLDFGVLGSTGTLTVANPGTATASVRFSISGPTPSGGFVITDASTGKTITYLGSVPEGSTLVIDSADGSSVIDGLADRLGDTVVQAWPTVPRESSRDFLFESLGGTTAATLTAEVVATYW